GQWQSTLPSRFIDELPGAAVEVLTAPGLYGRTQAASSDMASRASRADVYNSPGWKRLQSRSGRRGLGQPREVKHTIIDLDAVSAFAKGERVFHAKFGYGAVAGIEGDKLEIDFEKAGRKNVLAAYVR
ncbi:MAG: DUF3553 domain-containing protein, partial [Boseongicola sp. SB0670_bin_30]|nr:DUF3553 domain-containing protein [Boseongicola sp. SB0670_bin_30]